MDIVQEGNVGLLKAAEYFDYRVNKFSNYAGEFVKGYVLRSFSNKGSAIRKPVRTIEDYLKINEEKIKFLLMHGIHDLNFIVTLVRSDMKLVKIMPMRLLNYIIPM